ncbi:MAG TPA: imidazoleglycerol-phosphate dehydratase HisB [Bacteroidota bacterium]|nr:imidazoleglycerol-phosphate dehydratase HisB [Bacteroidota bacterium]
MRTASLTRTTKETDITASLTIDGGTGSEISTGIGFFDHMLELFTKHGLFQISLACKGDVHVDDHHTIEDVGIVLGQLFAQALGDKSGIARYGHAYVPMDEALARCVIDLSGRACVVYRAEFARETVGGMSTEMIEHFFRSFGEQLKANIHLEVLYGSNGHHISEALFKSFGRALRIASDKDPRVEGVLSTKGVLQ